MIRDFWFLQDSVSGEFYTGQGNYISTFQNAAVYFSEKNAKFRVRGIISSWEHDLKYPIDEKYRGEFTKSGREWPNDMTNARKDLADWGIKIVKGTVKI